MLNRANARMTIFADAGDYEAFEQVLAEAVERTGTTHDTLHERGCSDCADRRV